MPSTTHPFDDAMRLVSAGDGRWTGQTSTDYGNMVGPFGGTTAAVLPHGVNNGFIRGVLRGMARDRKLRDIGPAAPFTLTLFSDDALTLADPATGRSIELGSFGPTNRQSFADLLLLHRPVPSKAALIGRVDL